MGMSLTTLMDSYILRQIECNLLTHLVDMTELTVLRAEPLPFGQSPVQNCCQCPGTKPERGQNL